MDPPPRLMTIETKISKYDELEKLADLKNKGVISEEEFIAEKRKILGTDEPAQEIVQETTKESAQNTEENNKEKSHSSGGRQPQRRRCHGPCQKPGRVFR